jgi:GTPase
VVADIPGIIEGASQGAGLGLRFLRHIERTKVVCCLISADPFTDVDPVKSYDIVERELMAYSPALARKPRIVALNKADLPDVKEKAASLKRRFKRRGIDLMVISGLTGLGVRDLLERFWKALEEARSVPAEA